MHSLCVCGVDALFTCDVIDLVLARRQGKPSPLLHMSHTPGRFNKAIHPPSSWSKSTGSCLRTITCFGCWPTPPSPSTSQSRALPKIRSRISRVWLLHILCVWLRVIKTLCSIPVSHVVMWLTICFDAVFVRSIDQIVRSFVRAVVCSFDRLSVRSFVRSFVRSIFRSLVR